MDKYGMRTGKRAGDRHLGVPARVTQLRVLWHEDRRTHLASPDQNAASVAIVQENVDAFDSGALLSGSVESDSLNHVATNMDRVTGRRITNVEVHLRGQVVWRGH